MINAESLVYARVQKSCAALSAEHRVRMPLSLTAADMRMAAVLSLWRSTSGITSPFAMSDAIKTTMIASNPIARSTSAAGNGLRSALWSPVAPRKTTNQSGLRLTKHMLNMTAREVMQKDPAIVQLANR